MKNLAVPNNTVGWIPWEVSETNSKSWFSIDEECTIPVRQEQDSTIRINSSSISGRCSNSKALRVLDFRI